MTIRERIGSLMSTSSSKFGSIRKDSSRKIEKDHSNPHKGTDNESNKKNYMSLTPLDEEIIEKVASDGTLIVTVNNQILKIKNIEDQEVIYEIHFKQKIKDVDMKENTLGILVGDWIVVIDAKTQEIKKAFKHQKGPMFVMGIHVSEYYLVLILSDNRIEVYSLEDDSEMPHDMLQSRIDSEWVMMSPKNETKDEMVENELKMGEKEQNEIDDKEIHCKKIHEEANHRNFEYEEKVFTKKLTQYHLKDIYDALNINYPIFEFETDQVDVLHHHQIVGLKGNMLTFPTGSKRVGRLSVITILSTAKYDIRYIDAHASHIACVALSKSGSLLASCSVSGKVIRIFDLMKMTPSAIHTFRRAHMWSSKEPMVSLSFSHENNFLACMSMTGTVHLFVINQTHELFTQLSKKKSSSAWSSYLPSFSGSSELVDNRRNHKTLGKLSSYFSDEWSCWQYETPKALFSDLRLISLVFDGECDDTLHILSPELGGLLQSVSFNLHETSIREVTTLSGIHGSSMPSSLMIYLDAHPQLLSTLKHIVHSYRPLSHHRYLVPNDILFSQLSMMIRHTLGLSEAYHVDLYDVDGKLLHPSTHLMIEYQSRAKTDSFLALYYHVHWKIEDSIKLPSH